MRSIGVEAAADPRVRRVLAVADWSVDPGIVAAALAAHDRRRAAIYGLLVPARVGDPEAVPAVDDALTAWRADEIGVFEREHRLRLPGRLGLARRLERHTGLPVTRVALPRKRRRCEPEVRPRAVRSPTV